MNHSISSHLIALIVLLLVFISRAHSLHSLSKRYQIPVSDSKNIPQTDRRSVRDNILDRFHINANTIIRTHDSRALGAKYLNETELASNEDCLYWCWQTSPCNLAVYEQKSRGSCYLFDCGSNEDFRCKFTAHNFYSSSMLQVNRHPYDLSQWGSQVQHEKELTKLRQNGPYLTDITVSPASRSSTPSVRNLVAPSIVPTTTATSNFQKSSHCLHYQFECRNNSECIAIYNVCDGIPQCSDGSDESTDLECHKSRFNTPNMKSDQEMSSTLKLGQTVNNKKLEVKSPQKLEPPNYPRIAETKGPQVIPVYNYPKNPNSDNVRPPNDQSGVAKKPNFIGPEESGAKNGYPPQYRGAWNQYYQQNDGFNSGDNRGNSAGYVVEPEYLNQYNNRENSNPGSYWPTIGRQSSYDLSDQMLSPGGQTYLSMSNKPLAGTPDEWTPNNPNNNYDSNYYDRISKVRGNKVEGVENSAPNELSAVSKSFANPKHDIKSDSGFKGNTNSLNHMKYEKQLKSQSKGKTDSIKTKTFSKPNISYSHISSNKGYANSPGIVAVSYMHDSSQQNGRETNSAVIALSLGLCVTALLIVLVGCRMKSFKRKIARRGRPLAHDADYLVNGMYL